MGDVTGAVEHNTYRLGVSSVTVGGGGGGSGLGLWCAVLPHLWFSIQWVVQNLLIHCRLVEDIWNYVCWFQQFLLNWSNS